MRQAWKCSKSFPIREVLAEARNCALPFLSVNDLVWDEMSCRWGLWFLWGDLTLGVHVGSLLRVHWSYTHLETSSLLSLAALLDRSVTARPSFWWQNWSFVNPVLKMNCSLERRGDQSEALFPYFLQSFGWLWFPKGILVRDVFGLRLGKTGRGLEEDFSAVFRMAMFNFAGDVTWTRLWAKSKWK